MKASKIRYRAIKSPLKTPIVTTGRVQIVKEKYLEKPSVYDEVPLDCWHDSQYIFEKVINEMYAESRLKQLDVCRKKYRFGLLDHLKSFWDALCHRVNNLSVTIAFYVQRGDVTRVGAVKSFKSIFEKCGHLVDIEYSEARWHKFVNRYVPIFAHCVSEVSGNPIVHDGVKMAIFDFDDSLNVARDSIMFCDTSLGYQGGFYDVASSIRFFRTFYKEIVIGQDVLSTYWRLCSNFSIAPALLEKVQNGRDFVINSNLSRESYD